MITILVLAIMPFVFLWLLGWTFVAYMHLKYYMSIADMKKLARELQEKQQCDRDRTGK